MSFILDPSTPWAIIGAITGWSILGWMLCWVIVGFIGLVLGIKRP